MKIVTLTAPAAWASALVNRDHSGLTEQDLVEIGVWLIEHEVADADALDVGETYIGQFDGKLCEVADYVFPLR